jgi:hypothetical protein
MNGHVYTNLLLTCAGNRFLGVGDIAGFWLGSDAFRFTQSCEFRELPSVVEDGAAYPLVANDPLDWFVTLKPGVRGLRLHHTARKRAANQQTEVSDRMLAGMVGGGQRWLIEAVGESDSELWEGFERIGDREEPNRKIWLWTFIRQGKAPRTAMDADVSGLGLDDAVAHFRQALTDVEAYARTESYDNFAEIFREALSELDRAAEGTAADWGDARYTGFDPRRLSIMSAASRASVFGGMGSWNDLGGGEAYDKVSEALYSTLNDCIMALANSTCAG